MIDSLLWVEKYRPKTIDDCVLSDSIKTTLRDVVSQNKIPNLNTLIAIYAIFQKLTLELDIVIFFSNYEWPLS